jgi:SLT domain-containing protein
MHPNGAGVNSGTAYKTSPSDFQTNMSTAIKKGVPQEWAPIMSEIVKRESSFNPKALNKSSGTYGYAQFQEYNVDSYNKKYGLDYRNNPADQLIAMYHYIEDRYKTPAKALAFWNAKGYY